ncbi:MAG: spiro-SPASM protein [Spirochaetes bacterium]|nr:MAG: spiro-SPASM protein [Spirochaetota bacterium]
MSMKNLAIINIAGISSLSYEAVFGGPSAFDRVQHWASSIPEASGIVFFADPDTPVPHGTLEVGEEPKKQPFARMRVIRRDKWTEKTLVEALITAAKLPGESSQLPPVEALFYTWGDFPLIDNEISMNLWKLHYKFDAEYSFADGYPVGLAPEILSVLIPEKLMPLAVNRDNPVVRDSLFEILRQDINAFDVETQLSPVDMRMDRVSISTDTRRNVNIAEQLYAAGGVDAESLCRVIPENRVLLRNLPAFFPIQITDYCPQACSYCPFPKYSGDPRDGRNYMDLNVFEDLCRRIVSFAGDAVIGLSLWGEPAAHPEIGKLIQAALAAGNTDSGPSRSRVLIETSGIGWDRTLIEELAGETETGRMMWIVSLDASDPELYRSLRGEGQVEAEETARHLTKFFGSNCWLQAVRMKENEEHLEEFYKKWNAEGAQVIIQKYDSYASYLPERQPADLSPLQRFPCWHLKRDMPVLIDGDVPLCRDDLGRRDVSGNVFEEDFEKVWAAGNELHAQHVSGEFPGPCADCDEYYCFNF